MTCAAGYRQRKGYIFSEKPKKLAIHMAVLSKMKKGKGNLAYFGKNNYSFQN